MKARGLRYLKGLSLKNYVEKNGSIPAGEIREVLSPVVKVLAALHSKNRIHRNVNPDNIMLLPGSRVKLINIGKVRDCTELNNRKRDLTGTDKLSTPSRWYAPVEQFHKTGVEGSYTDIYALCAVIYKCLTGETPEASYERVMDDQLKSPSELGVAIPEDMERALMKGMSLRIGGRYQSVREFWTDFCQDYDEETSGEEESEKTEGKANRTEKEESGKKETGKSKKDRKNKKNGKGKKNRKDRKGRKAPIIAAVIAIFVIAAGSLWLWQGAGGGQDTETQQGAKNPKNLSEPEIVADSSMEAGQKVTYDCVWFGSYPQAEVVSEKDEAQIAALKGMNDNYETKYEIVSEEEFEKIANADYDENGDAAVDGKRYRRMKKEDALKIGVNSGTPRCYYDWIDSISYHYFKYEPIKWRVLEVRDGAVLFSDVVLDDQQYNTVWTSVSWEKSTIRSWLSSYDGDSNDEGEDYSSGGFLKTAFTSSEQEAIWEVNFKYGFLKKITEKIFLLFDSQVYSTDTAKSYGFAESEAAYDEARRAKPSTYAFARGIECIYSSSDSSDYLYEGKCSWWISSVGSVSGSAIEVGGSGQINTYGDAVRCTINGVRPALYLDLSATETYSYAGTVCTDGTVEEVEP